MALGICSFWECWSADSADLLQKNGKENGRGGGNVTQHPHLCSGDQLSPGLHACIKEAAEIRKQRAAALPDTSVFPKKHFSGVLHHSAALLLVPLIPEFTVTAKFFSCFF